MKKAWIHKEKQDLEQLTRRVPRWSYVCVVITIGLLLSTVSDTLTIGPSWTVLIAALILFIPLSVAILRGHQQRARMLAIIIATVVTLGLVSSVVFLIYALFNHSASASDLFRDAALLWIANILVFATWYWEIDQGGPQKRHSGQQETPDFLFPQMASNAPAWTDWIPAYMDYIFLAFNTNTAFSPTDTMVMTRRAKLLMMLQASISLLIIAVLGARAVNIA
jgi:hypothetical protein